MFKKGDKVIAIVDIDGKISKGTIGICYEDCNSKASLMPIKWESFIGTETGWGAENKVWGTRLVDIKLYQESIKTLNKDTVKVGQKVRICNVTGKWPDDNNNAKFKNGDIGIVTSIKESCDNDKNHLWVTIDNQSLGIGTNHLELLEEPKLESIPVIKLEIGKYYKTKDVPDGFSAIFKVIEPENGSDSKFSRCTASFITTEKEFKKSSKLCYRGSVRICEEAIFSDRQWLDKCIELGKYISKEEALKEEVEKYYPNEFKSKDVIPEYVECIKGYHTDLSINDFNVVGKIYEVESYNSKSKALKLKGFRNTVAAIKFDGNSGDLATDYKISTKKAFDLQNQPKENLVGRYLKALVNNPVCIGMNIGEYLLVTRFNTDDGTYSVTRVRDICAGFGIKVSDLPKFEIMPIGFNLNKIKDKFIVGKDYTGYTTDRAIYKSASINGDIHNFPEGHIDKINTNTMELTADWCIKLTDAVTRVIKPWFISKNPEFQQRGWTNGYYYGVVNGICRADNCKSDRFINAKELTLDEFKRLVLKEGTSPVEFKVGDWVVITANTNASVNYVGDVGQITGDFDSKHFKVTVKGRPGFSNSTRITDMRLATSSEIHEAQKLERDEFISQAVEKLEVPYPTRSYKNFKECYTKLPIVTSVKRSNIVPLKLEKQKSLINLPTI